MFKIIRNDILIILTILVISEATLQLFFPEYTHYLFDNKYTGSHLINRNEEGYRGELIPKKASENEIRIMALGDSVTEGTGVSYKDVWPHKLNEFLQKEYTDQKITVINAGEGGAGLQSLIYKYKILSEKYHPQIVILTISNALVSRSWKERDIPISFLKKRMKEQKLTLWEQLKIKVNRLVHWFALPSFISINSQRALYFLGVLHHDFDPQTPLGSMFSLGLKQQGNNQKEVNDAWNYFTDELKQFRKIVRENNAELIIVGMPERFFLSNDPIDNEKYVPVHRLTINSFDKLKNISNKLHIPVVLPLEALKKYRKKVFDETGIIEPLYIPFDYTHFSETGHVVIAEEVLKKIKQQKLIEDEKRNSNSNL